MEEYQQAFARIEREVDAGNTDLSGLGFWGLLGKVKLDRALSAHWAEVAGRIDRKAFEGRVRPRFPVWLGNAALVAGSAVLVVLVVLGMRIADRSATPDPWLAGALVLVAGAGLGVSLHDLAHWVVGRLGGIRFVAYFLDGPFRVQPGLKIDYGSYLQAGPGARAWMHAAWALATKVAPFAVFAAVYFPHRARDYDLLPPWSLWGLLAVGVIQIVTDVLWSVRLSDWKKVRRERNVGRAQRDAGV